MKGDSFVDLNSNLKEREKIKGKRQEGRDDDSGGSGGSTGEIEDKFKMIQVNANQRRSTARLPFEYEHSNDQNAFSDKELLPKFEKSATDALKQIQEMD
jgi:hypothetical protein